MLKTNVASLLAAAMMGIGALDSARPPRPVQYNAPVHNRFMRGRQKGEHQPSGSKLAKKAKKGTVGLARLK